MDVIEDLTANSHHMDHNKYVVESITHKFVVKSKLKTNLKLSYTKFKSENCEQSILADCPANYDEVQVIQL